MVHRKCFPNYGGQYVILTGTLEEVQVALAQGMEAAGPMRGSHIVQQPYLNRDGLYEAHYKYYGLD